MSEKRKGAIFCSQDGEWKDELENRGFQNVKREFMLAGHILPSEIVSGDKPRIHE